MISRSRRWERIVVGTALSVFAIENSASAADLPRKAPAFKAPLLKAVYDWTGFYVGGHFGYGLAALVPTPTRFRCKARCCRTAPPA